ncbi:MAG TPA: N-acetyltransferase [Chloroflexia bacterium]|nr:N-acetyltransferase [Chloroflexia bacterium]
MLIRAENWRDYAAVAAVHVRAFEERAAEATIVALHRQRTAYDPELSLVAEEDGRIVGHVLFSPHRVNILGEVVQAVNLAPIAIDPAYQKQGVGKRLIETGHNIAREKGYAFSFLLGHPSYYPRLGYLTNAYGSAKLTLQVAGLPEPALVTRPVAEADIPALYAIWKETESEVDFSLDPGQDLIEWLSPNPAVAAVTYLRDNQVVGYTRIHSAHPVQPAYFLAKDAVVAREMAALLARQASITTIIELPLHPGSAIATGLGEAEARAWEPAMVYPLTSSPFDTYYSLVKSNHRPPGRPIWPIEFDLE